MRDLVSRSPFSSTISRGAPRNHVMSGRLLSGLMLSLMLTLAPVGAALADGGGGGGGGGIGMSGLGQPQNLDFVQARQRIDQGDFRAAVPLLEKVVSANDRDADAYNLLGYSLRKLGRFDEALRNYERALAIAPKHRGAHEYIGETYLALNQPEKAKQHLKILDDDCWFGCKEYDDLKEAIAQYEAKRGS